MRYKCNMAGCREFIPAPGLCPSCLRRTRKSTDTRRGTAAQRGYGREHRDARTVVLDRDPLCKCDAGMYCHGTDDCWEQSTVADHFPHTRKELVAAGQDPNDPDHMRGLCKRCHDKRKRGR